MDSYLQALQQKLSEQLGIREMFSNIITIAFKLGTVKKESLTVILWEGQIKLTGQSEKLQVMERK